MPIKSPSAWLKDFQEKNCKGCCFAIKEKVGTGSPCCTLSGVPHINIGNSKDGNGKCTSRREG